MAFSLRHMPGFVADDAVAMFAALLAALRAAMRQGVTDEDAYDATLRRVFGNRELADWVHLPPPTIAKGVTTLIREVGLFVIADTDVALDALRTQMRWHADLAPVPAVRVVASDPVWSPSRAQQRENRLALETLVHRAALLAYAERLPGTAIGSLALAAQYHAVIRDDFGAVIAEASARNDGAAHMLRHLATTAWQLVDKRAGPVREEGVLTLAANLPSLVVAHLAYRESRQAPRIRRANPVAHPAFMPQRLAVLPWP